MTQDYFYRKHVPRLAMLRYLKCTDPEIAPHLAEVVEEESVGASTAPRATSTCSTIWPPGWA